MTYTTQRSFDSNLPPSQRRKLNKDDFEKRQKLATSYAQSINKQNAQSINKEQKGREEALALLTEGVPSEDVLYYVAKSQGKTLSEYQRERDHQFQLDVERKKREYASKAHREVLQRYENEELRLIQSYANDLPETKTKGRK